MALIALEGVHFYAYHGFYEEEQIIGNNFVLDVYVEANTAMAARADDLFATVNYETIYRICQMEMRTPAQLLETVAQRIANHIQDQFDNVRGVKVRLSKMAPPLGGKVGRAYVELSVGAMGGGMDGGEKESFGFPFKL